jgi:hypothetical protein
MRRRTFYDRGAVMLSITSIKFCCPAAAQNGFVMRRRTRRRKLSWILCCFNLIGGHWWQTSGAYTCVRPHYRCLEVYYPITLHFSHYHQLHFSLKVSHTHLNSKSEFLCNLPPNSVLIFKLLLESQQH